MQNRPVAGARIDNHCGIQVADAGRAAAFYVEALGGRIVVEPTRIARGRPVMGGDDTCAFTLCIVGFDAGAVELFSFDPGTEPEWATARAGARLPHFGVQVDDVRAALERVEAHGGRRVWPDVLPLGPVDAIYCADPDGNAFELISGGMDEVAAVLNRGR